jgi:hypothetical protein
VRNEWNSTTLLSIRLYGLHKEKITLYILCHDFIQCPVDDAFHSWLKEKKMKRSVIRNSLKELTYKANMVRGSSYFVTKINLTRTFTKYKPTVMDMLEIMVTEFKAD